MRLLVLCLCSFNLFAVNINTATIAELQQVKGISHKKAMAIVQYRRSYGLYNNISELVRIKGIGSKWVLKMNNCLNI